MKTAIILSAGKGSRMGADIPKQYLELAGHPIIYYPLKAFQESIVEQIVLVCSKNDREFCEKLVKENSFDKVVCVVEGGKERYHSVYNGLKAAPNTDYVFIHDGARAFIDQQTINNCYEDVKKYEACVAAVPVKDTIKISKDGYIDSTPDRKTLYSMQTPQTFSYPLIMDAYEKLIEQENEILNKGISVTDDTFVLELFSDKKVYISDGSYNNIKITTPEDLLMGELLLKGMRKG